MILFANKTSLEKPEIQWQKLKKKILGDKYELSVVFASDGLLRILNRRYNKKNKTTAVLSFSLAEDFGEIFLNLPFIKKEAKRAKIEFLKHFAYLYIHSLFHLKGFKHSRKMIDSEKKFLKNT